MPLIRGEPSRRRVAIVLWTWASMKARTRAANSGSAASISPQLAIRRDSVLALGLGPLLELLAQVGGLVGAALVLGGLVLELGLLGRLALLGLALLLALEQVLRLVARLSIAHRRIIPQAARRGWRSGRRR